MGDVTPDSIKQLLSIGEFARRTQLTVKALRIYNEIGLLRPVDVDPSNGYRRYGVDQIRTARLIGMFRGADLGLAEIGLLLDDLETDGHAAAARLDRHLIALEARHTSRRFLIRHIRAILREEEGSMFSIATRHVPAQRVMSIQRRLRAPETDAFVKEAKAAFVAHLEGAPPAGPFTLIFHGIVDHETDGPLEATLGCPEDTRPPISSVSAPSRHMTKPSPRSPKHSGNTRRSSPPMTRWRARPRRPLVPEADCRVERCTWLNLTRSLMTA